MDKELRTLLTAWLTDDVDEAALRPILERLKNDREFRAEFVAEILLLGQLKAVQASEPRWLELDDAIGANSAELDFEDRVMQSLKPARKKRSPWRFFAVAAAVVAAGMMWLARPKSPVTESAKQTEYAAEAVAVLSVLHAAKVTEGERGPGPLVIEDGLVQIDFFSGVRMLLRGPAEIEIRSASEVYMHSGEASCYVSELGRGFRILTADGEVIDLGTAFGIRVRPAQSAEVHVFEGEVSVRPQNSSAATGFHAEEAVSLGADRLSPVVFARDGFPDAAEINNRDQASYDRWLQSSAVLSADSDVLLHCTFEGHAPLDSELHNHAKAKLRSSHGAIMGTQWGRGRWPMKSALNFRAASDRVLFKLPGSFRQLTMLVWVRVDAWPNQHHAVLLTETAERWRIHGNVQPEELAAANKRRAETDAFAMRWTLREHGGGNLNFLRGDAEGAVIGDGHGLVPLIGEEGLGQWHCLATVYDADAGTVTYFMNGVVYTQPAKYRGPVHCDFMELGNLSLAEIDNEQRVNFRFHGAFDEVLIAKRAMKVSEIQAIYKAGLPE
ncbi:MAG: hypothetical protein ACI8W8_003182 [Rhodothermales bacterium]